MSRAEPVDADALAEVLGLVGVVYRRAVRALDEQAGGEGLPAGVRAVAELLQLAGPATVPGLAQTLVLSRQFTQRSVDEALARGLVELRDNPRHRRSRVVALTEAGERAVQDARARERALIAASAPGVAAGDVEACGRVLRALHAALAAGGDVSGA